MKILNGKFLKSLSFELLYNPDDEQQGSFKVYLQKVKSYKKHAIILVYGKGNVSPAQYPEQTYKSLKQMLNEISINMDETEVYVDLLEYVGIKDNRIYKWESSNCSYFDKVEQINFDNNKVLSDFFYGYYKDKWSTLISSTLNQREKIDIFARIFSESFLDEYLIQELTNKFHNKLIEVSDKNENLVEYFTSRTTN
ncbi:hypothetical protein Cpap_1293 [Ruminiclostridium papyrosolvens DSM 2782]|uniref:Uncharacterized protein n=1 Tax=Ruminiclostridium papyrosolvens DSM 2782 TaxID=588581 RepID=F1TFM2_9FIRM|nr:hypothetical protein [Ruminiclostridium papyrosolvens]EGD46754.1 hypothetical protein Cpap_1293 [Ruminiclostridium papyrosolvens DSM 2782]WES34905.1 hypothetical protein P0092_02695 [Ruminiclostridium papyrosolvens DSM 2782]